MYDFHKFSLNPLEVQPDTEVILLVITRWDSQDKRQSIRQMITNSQGWSAAHIRVIQIRMDQGLVVKIRCPMRS